MTSDASNIPFQLAARFVNQTSRHVFLTGKAGTGKTTFLRYLKDNAFKKMAVVAPTGVAAMNAGGMTIHSFFNLPFGTYIHNRQAWGGEAGNVYNKHQLFHKARLSNAKRSIIRETELLVIDEVSMVRADVLDAMDALLRNIRKRQEPFGGVQMLFIGDLFQLPPVVKDEDWSYLKDTYRSPFFFDALVMQEASAICIELEKIYRQQDLRFVELLNNVRNNCCSREDFDLLRAHYHPEFEPAEGEDYITLTTHNFKAEAINKRKMDQLPGEPVQLEAAITGDFPENIYPVDRSMSLKKGTQVMFIKNDKGEARRYFNGKIGLIEELDAARDLVQVRFPGEPDLFTVEKETWHNIRYQFDPEKDRITEEEAGSFTQYPIRPAWAVTIHKSQGLTFTKAAVDAGRSFAPGQVYVALSRLTTLEGLVLKSLIEPGAISTDPQVLAFSRQTHDTGALQELLETGQKEFAGKSLLQAFEWGKLREETSQFLADYEKRTIPEKEKGYLLFLDISRQLLQLEEIGGKFTLQLRQLLQTDILQLEERTRAATDWFRQQLEQKILIPIDRHIREMKGKPRIKKYLEELQHIHRAFERRQYHLEQVNAVTKALAHNRDMEELMEEVSKMHRPSSPVASAEGTTTNIAAPNKPAKGETKRISLELYRQGKSIREIAQERELVTTTIEGHLVSFIPTGEVTVDELVAPEKIPVIREAVESTSAMSLTSLKEKLGPGYSYLEIKAVVEQIRVEGKVPDQRMS